MSCPIPTRCVIAQTMNPSWRGTALGTTSVRPAASTQSKRPRACRSLFDIHSTNFMFLRPLIAASSSLRSWVSSISCLPRSASGLKLSSAVSMLLSNSAPGPSNVSPSSINFRRIRQYSRSIPHASPPACNHVSTGRRTIAAETDWRDRGAKLFPGAIGGSPVALRRCGSRVM